MNTRNQPDSSNKLAILPMWVIDRIKEEMRLGPAARQAITDAVERAEVPQALPCEVKLPPGTVIAQGAAVSTLMLSIQQRTSQPAHAQVFSSAEPEQTHAEPVAWMVGTAIWWTKEEAERDAAAMGLPVVTLGPCAGLGDHERLRTELVESDLAFVRAATEAEQLRAKQAERATLLRDNSGKLIRMAAHLISAPLFALQDLQDEDKKMTRARVDKAVDTADARLKDAAYELRRIADALSASAGPSSPTWSCQACQVEQPTDRACDACGGQTALITAKS